MGREFEFFYCWHPHMALLGQFAWLLQLYTCRKYFQLCTLLLSGITGVRQSPRLCTVIDWEYRGMAKSPEATASSGSSWLLLVILKHLHTCQQEESLLCFTLWNISQSHIVGSNGRRGVVDAAAFLGILSPF